MASKPKLITADDLYKFQLITDAQISPDGTKIIFCVQRVDEKTEKKYTNLWLAPTGTGKLRQFTYGDWSDSHPRWSPDGTQIAFLSNRKDEAQSQIYLLPIDGGEARMLTEFKDMTPADFAWSPDGKAFLSNIRKKDAEAIEREANPEKKKLGVVARHITALNYKNDGQGFLPQEKWHIWRIDANWGTVVDGNENDDLIQVLWDGDRSPLPTPTIAVIKLSEKEQFLEEMKQFYPPFSYWWQLQDNQDFSAIFVKDTPDENSYSTFGIHTESLITVFPVTFGIPSRGVIPRIRLSLKTLRDLASTSRTNIAVFDEGGAVYL